MALTDHMPPPIDAAIAAHTLDATRTYGSGDTEVTALDRVTVSFQTGQFTAIMGPSGSGKSTLMHCLAGLDRVTGGEVIIAGVPLSTLNDRQLTRLRRDRIGFVFQAFNLVPTLTARQNIELPMKLAGASPDTAWIEHVVSTVGLGDRMDHRPNELSGGQQQRVAVARALASRPEIVFADEPTGNLDSVSGHEVLTFLRDAADDMNQTIVMVTHDASAASVADRVVFLADGRIANDLTDPTADRIHDAMRTIGR